MSNSLPRDKSQRHSVMLSGSTQNSFLRLMTSLQCSECCEKPEFAEGSHRKVIPSSFMAPPIPLLTYCISAWLWLREHSCRNPAGSTCCTRLRGVSSEILDSGMRRIFYPFISSCLSAYISKNEDTGRLRLIPESQSHLHLSSRLSHSSNESSIWNLSTILFGQFSA